MKGTFKFKSGQEGLDLRRSKKRKKVYFVFVDAQDNLYLANSYGDDIISSFHPKLQLLQYVDLITLGQAS